MDNVKKIQCIKKQLESIKLTQPVLYKLWKLTIHKNEARFIKTLLNCQDMLENVKDLNKELSLLDIQTLVVLKDTIMNNETL